MTEITRKETREVEVVTAYKCDGCGKEFGNEDWAELQEMLHWRNNGGYGSIFGDCTNMALDLCQHCVKERLGDILRFPEDDMIEDA
jgi:hypothetical protein